MDQNNTGFDVFPFSREALAKAFSNEYITEELVPIKKEKHFRHFFDYLNPSNNDGIKARTIVIEEEYLSKSYFRDYQNYYATCFQGYKRRCKRVHFFNVPFDKEGFSKDLFCKEKEYIKNESYLGLVVIKPLPEILFGASILAIPNNSDKEKIKEKIIINSTREYKIHLFGAELNLKSIAFQEQDRVVSACATSALWTTFHKTSDLFQTKLPTPSDITIASKNLFFESGRITPNEGLDHFQIGNSIEDTGLVFELRADEKKLNDINWLKSFIYSYNRIGLPVMLGLKFNGEDENDENDENGENLHLITVLGYEQVKLEFGRNDNGISTFAEKIEKFYAHDDQVGPFSELKFCSVKDNCFLEKIKIKIKKKKDKENNETRYLIKTAWIEENGTNKTAEVASVFVPLVNHIRIKFEDVYNVILKLDLYFQHALSDEFEMIWDIYLAKGSDYKSKFIQKITSGEEDKKLIYQNVINNVLFARFPEYIWVARAYVDHIFVFEIVFDSTDIANGFFCRSINIFNEDIRAKIEKDIETIKGKEFFEKYLGVKFLDLLIKATSEKLKFE